MKLTRLSVVVLGLLVASCGYRPLYQTAADGSSVTHDLAAVEVAAQDTRVGQLIRNEIVASISPAGTAAAKAYVLELDPQASDDPTVTASNTDVRRRAYMIKAAFALREASSGRELMAGQTFSSVSYDRTSAAFANLQAQTNAEMRAAKEIGADIRTRLAAYFATR